MSSTVTPNIQVLAVIPFSEFGSDELIVVPAGEEFQLPTGALASGERVLDAVVRIVKSTIGIVVVPVRLAYVIEGVDDAVIFGVLCDLGDALEDTTELHGEVASPGSLGDRFVPVALREVLMEDLRSGFVRPVAHIVSGGEQGSTGTAVTW